MYLTSIEILGSFAGIPIPEGIRLFDCRSPDDAVQAKAPWGETLWSGEKAAYDLGLKRGWSDDDSTTPLSCHTYVDSRTAGEEELARQMQSAFAEVANLLRAYDKAKERPSTNGGSCYYQPVAVTLSNFGWGILCDKRTCVVRAFEG